MERFPEKGSGKVESSSERILSKEMVVQALERYAGKDTVPVCELSDEKGLYLLEVEKPGEAAGETTQYYYIRKGRHGNHNESSETKIAVTYYQDETPISGHDIATLDEETGEWA